MMHLKRELLVKMSMSFNNYAPTKFLLRLAFPTHGIFLPKPSKK